MKGFVKNIEVIATENENFRQVLYTAQHCQLVMMSLKPGEEIGTETHKLDQFFRVEAGSGEAVLDDVRSPIREGFAIRVPAGMEHNIINTGTESLKLYSVYSPPTHRDGVVHHSYADAAKDDEYFDGKLTERPIPITSSDHGGSIPVSYRSRLTLRFSSPSATKA
jgi:mannose-6-phosphate isomerase-like protein (cupin superfamily)